MKEQQIIQEIERKQEELDLEKEKLGIETGITEDEKFVMNLVAERDKRIKIGLGSMILGRILFGKFAK